MLEDRGLLGRGSVRVQHDQPQCPRNLSPCRKKVKSDSDVRWGVYTAVAALISVSAQSVHRSACAAAASA